MSGQQAQQQLPNREPVAPRSYVQFPPILSTTKLRRQPLKRPIDEVARALFELDEPTKRLSVEIFEQAMCSGRFSNNRRHVLIFASIAAACKEGGFPLGIKEIARVARDDYDITVSTMFQHTNAITRMRNVKTGPVDPIVFLDRSARDLSVVDTITIAAARGVIEKLKETGFNCGRLQRLTCMIALHIVSPEILPLRKIIALPGIGSPTAKALLFEMQKRLEPDFSPTTSLLRSANSRVS